MLEQFGCWPVDGGLYAQDPDFIDELRIARAARNDHQLFESDVDPKQAERRRKGSIARRKAELARRHDRVKRGKHR